MPGLRQATIVACNNSVPVVRPVYGSPPCRNEPVTEVETVLLEMNPVKGVDIAKQREEGRCRLGQPGINAGPTTG